MSKKSVIVNAPRNPDRELEDFQSFLGPLAAEYSDQQLRQLRYEMYSMAELLLEAHENRTQPDTRQTVVSRFDSQH